jgi:UDPglucose--hexose-1-phosphate uridylyltransferase
VAFELDCGERVVLATEHHLALAPYASRFPFEVVILPLRQCHDMTLMSDLERADLADVLVQVLRRLRRALDNPPYNYMLFNAPSTVGRAGRPDYWGTLPYDWRWHLEIVPRIQETAGFEWGTGFYINPVAPEEAAAFLRQAE